MFSNIELARQFRKVAAELRQQAKKAQQVHLIKCAQVLIAARGLTQLKRILEGAEK